MAVVDDGGAVPARRGEGRRQAGEVVAVIDIRNRRRRGRCVRPAKDRLPPAEEPVDEAPARRWPLSPETAGQADEQPQGEER